MDRLWHCLSSGAGWPQASLIGSHRWILKPEFLRDDDPGGPKRVERERERERERGTLYSHSHNAVERKGRGTKRDQEQ